MRPTDLTAQGKTQKPTGEGRQAGGARGRRAGTPREVLSGQTGGRGPTSNSGAAGGGSCGGSRLVRHRGGVRLLLVLGVALPSGGAVGRARRQRRAGARRWQSDGEGRGEDAAKSTRTAPGAALAAAVRFAPPGRARLRASGGLSRPTDWFYPARLLRGVRAAQPTPARRRPSFSC